MKLSEKEVNQQKRAEKEGCKKQRDRSSESTSRLLSIPNHCRTETNEAGEEHAK